MADAKAKKTRGADQPEALDVGALRKAFGVTRSTFQRLTGYSERSLADWESGKREVDGLVRRRLLELSRLHEALAAIIQPSALRTWLDTPSEAFEGLKPLEVIERGHTDRLWQMIFEFRFGFPS